MTDIKKLEEKDLEKVSGGTVWVVKRIFGNDPTICPVEGCGATLKSLGDINGFPHLVCAKNHEIKVDRVTREDRQTKYATAQDSWWG